MDTQNQSFITSDEEKLLVKKNEEKAIYSLVIGIALFVLNPYFFVIAFVIIFGLLYLVTLRAYMSFDTLGTIVEIELIIYFIAYVFLAIRGIRMGWRGRKTSKQAAALIGLVFNIFALVFLISFIVVAYHELGLQSVMKL